MAKTKKGSEPAESSDSDSPVEGRSTKKGAGGSTVKSKLLFCLLILCCCFIIILVSIAVAGFYYYLFKPKTAIVVTPGRPKRPKLSPAKRILEEEIEEPPVTLLRYEKKLNFSDAARECQSIPDAKYSLAFPKSPDDEMRIHRHYHNFLLRNYSTASGTCDDGVLLGMRRQLLSDWVSWDGKLRVPSPFFTRMFDPHLNPPPHPANCMCSKLEFMKTNTIFMQHHCGEITLNCYLCQKDCVDGVCKYEHGRAAKKMGHGELRGLCKALKGDLAAAPSKTILFKMIEALKDRPTECTDVAIGNRYGNNYENINEEPMAYKPVLLWMLATESITWSCIVIYPLGKVQWHFAPCDIARCYLCVRDD